MKRVSIKTESYTQYLFICLRYLAFIFSFSVIIAITSHIKINAFGGFPYYSSTSDGYFVHSDESKRSTPSSCSSSSRCTGIAISADTVTQPQELYFPDLGGNPSGTNSLYDNYIYKMAYALNSKVISGGHYFYYSFASSDATFTFYKNNSSDYEMRVNSFCYADLSQAIGSYNENRDVIDTCHDSNYGATYVFNAYLPSNGNSDYALYYVVFVNNTTSYSDYWKDYGDYKNFMSLKLDSKTCDYNTSVPCTTVTSSSLSVDISVKNYTAPIAQYSIKLCTNTNCSAGGKSYTLINHQTSGQLTFTSQFALSQQFKNLNDNILNGTYKVYLSLHFLVLSPSSTSIKENERYFELDTVEFNRKPIIRKFYITNNNPYAHLHNNTGLPTTLNNKNVQIVLDSSCYTTSCTYTVGKNTFNTNPNGQYITLTNTNLSQNISVTIKDANGVTATNRFSYYYDEESPTVTVSYNGTNITPNSITTVSAGDIISIYIADKVDVFYPFASPPVLYSLSTDPNSTDNGVTADIGQSWDYMANITIPEMTTSNYLYLKVHALNIWDYGGNKLLLYNSQTYSDYYTFILEYDKPLVHPEIQEFTVIGNSSFLETGFTSTTTITASFTMDVESKYSYSIIDIVNGSEKAINTGEIYEVFKSKSISFSIQNIEGLHTIVLKVTSLSTTIGTYEIILDTTAPLISEFSAKGSNALILGYTNSTSIRVSIDATDDNTLYYKIRNTTSNSYSSTKPTSATLSSSIEGTKTLILTVSDPAGNSVTSEFSITLDKTKPSISEFNVQGADALAPGYTNSTSIKLSIDATDDNLLYYKVSNTNKSSFSNAKPTNATLSSSIEGTKTLILTVSDPAGNSVTSEFSITLDKTAPSVNSFVVGTNGYVNASTSPKDGGSFPWIPFELKMKDEDYYQYTISAVDQINFTGGNIYQSGISKFKESTGNVIIEKAEQGEYAVTLTVIDLAGNQTELERLVIRDTIAPVISKFETSSNFTKASTLDVSILASDSNTLSYKISNTDRNSYSNTKPTYVTLSNNNDGVHELTLSVMDDAGNITTKTISITLDTRKPEAVLNNTDICSSKELEGFLCTTSGSALDTMVQDNNIDNTKTIAYSLVSPTQLTSTELHTKMYEAIDAKENYHLPYTNTRQEYYVYGIYAPNATTDLAGNRLDCTYNLDDYCIIEFPISLSPSNETIKGLIFDSDLKLPENFTGENAYYKYQTDTKNPTIIIDVHTISYSNTCTVPTLLSSYSSALSLKNQDYNCDSHLTTNALVGYGNTYQFINLVVINVAPKINNNNGGVNLTITAGEEISNFGVSFTSSEGEKMEIDTLITLNGIRIKEINNNVPGVYSIRQSATDKNGRTAIVTSQITILEKEVVEEISNHVELEVNQEIILPSVSLPSYTDIKVETENETKVKEIKEMKEVEKIIEHEVRTNSKHYVVRKHKKFKNKDKLLFRAPNQNINNIHRINNLF